MKRRLLYKEQVGAVALFVVIFSTLLLSIVTVSFIQLMIKDQQQATNADLSRSAYDSAEAGVEDAKRALLLNQACGSSNDARCQTIRTALNSQQCNTLQKIFEPAAAGSEVMVQQQQGDGDAKLDQAYTCVKVAVDTDNITGSLKPNESTVVPLTAVGPYRQIEISWFSSSDLSQPQAGGGAGGSPTVEFPMTGNVQLPPLGSQWDSSVPALMRAQFIQMGPSFTLDDFDDGSGGGSDANTLFLYPSAAGAGKLSFANDVPRRSSTPPGTPWPVTCVPANVKAGGYACSVRIDLQKPVNGTANNRTAFLHLTALYNMSSYQIKLHSSNSINNENDLVQFAGAEPEVDSTGRANDLFRRIEARVVLQKRMMYPDAALSVTGNLCKDFTVTTDTSGYTSTCTP